MIIIIVCIAADFWYTKNISGRILVGLRWWNKYNPETQENIWMFENILNNYFCFCKGQKCIKSIINQNCKFFSYVHIIDNSRDLYLKTDYLFVDFIFSEFSSDDVFPIFERMKKQNYPVHYITEKNDILEKYCNNSNKCLTIIQITKNN
jgi:hypothetical protein